LTDEGWYILSETRKTNAQQVSKVSFFAKKADFIYFYAFFSDTDSHLKLFMRVYLIAVAYNIRALYNLKIIKLDK
jgi:hypothetical protein